MGRGVVDANLRADIPAAAVLNACAGRADMLTMGSIV